MILLNLKKDCWLKMILQMVTRIRRLSLSMVRLPTVSNIVEAVRSYRKSNQVEATERLKWALKIVWKRKMNISLCNDRNFWIKLNLTDPVLYKVVKEFIWWILIRDKLAVKILLDIHSIISLCKIVKHWPSEPNTNKAFIYNSKILSHRIIEISVNKYHQALAIIIPMERCQPVWSVSFSRNSKWICLTLTWWQLHTGWDSGNRHKFQLVQISYVGFQSLLVIQLAVDQD